MLYIAAFQIAAIGGLTLYSYAHSQEENRKYALMAERNAIAASNEFTLNFYKQTVVDRSQDRADMQLWVDRQITLRLAQAAIPQPTSITTGE